MHPLTFNDTILMGGEISWIICPDFLEFVAAKFNLSTFICAMSTVIKNLYSLYYVLAQYLEPMCGHVQLKML